MKKNIIRISHSTHRTADCWILLEREGYWRKDMHYDRWCVIWIGFHPLFDVRPGITTSRLAEIIWQIAGKFPWLEQKSHWRFTELLLRKWKLDLGYGRGVFWTKVCAFVWIWEKALNCGVWWRVGGGGDSTSLYPDGQHMHWRLKEHKRCGEHSVGCVWRMERSQRAIGKIHCGLGHGNSKAPYSWSSPQKHWTVYTSPSLHFPLLYSCSKSAVLKLSPHYPMPYTFCISFLFNTHDNQHVRRGTVFLFTYSLHSVHCSPPPGFWTQLNVKFN